jgi:hypothetical protein
MICKTFFFIPSLLLKKMNLAKMIVGLLQYFYSHGFNGFEHSL